jgi:hypothetical protein
MRIAWLVPGLALATGAHAQSAASRMTPELYRQMSDDMQYWDAQAKRYRVVIERAHEIFPARRNTPLRDVNISDEEIREIEALSRRYLPRAYVNISPVVGDCPCEEGPTCTAQVYVVAQTADQTRGLQFSRMNDRWNVGVVQQWWIRRDAVQRQHTGNSFLDDYLYQKAVNELYEEFPMCAGGQLVPATQAASTPKTPEKK